MFLFDQVIDFDVEPARAAPPGPAVTGFSTGLEDKSLKFKNKLVIGFKTTI